MLRVIYGPALLVLVGLSGCLWQEVPGINGVLAWDRVELIAELNEPIVHIEAREGQRLRAGDLILQQDDRLMAARLAEARAQLDQARGRLAELRRGPRMERIAAAQASLEGAEAEAGNAARELQRIERLQQQHLTSVEAVDLARTRASSADARVQVVRAALDELRHGSTREELEQAEAQVQQARARMAQLQVTLERLRITAPRDALLDELPFELGERPSAGKVVAVLLAGQAPYARVYVPEPLRAQLQRGSRAEVRVDGVARVFDGQIRRISADASFTPFNSLTERDRSRLSYLAEVELSGDGTESLPAGLPVQVRFEGLSL
jgi:HlyD family secretion protein